MQHKISNIVVPFTESFERQAILANAQEEPTGDSRLQMASPTYEIAYLDQDYIQRDHARAIRMQLETDKPEWFMQLAGIRSTVIVFGSARFVSPNRARRLLAEAN